MLKESLLKKTSNANIFQRPFFSFSSFRRKKIFLTVLSPQNMDSSLPIQIFYPCKLDCTCLLSILQYFNFTNWPAAWVKSSSSKRNCILGCWCLASAPSVALALIIECQCLLFRGSAPAFLGCGVLVLLGGVLEVVNFFLVAIPTNLCHLGSLIV